MSFSKTIWRIISVLVILGLFVGIWIPRVGMITLFVVAIIGFIENVLGE